jgi:hypothetical protein
MYVSPRNSRFILACPSHFPHLTQAHYRMSAVFHFSHEGLSPNRAVAFGPGLPYPLHSNELELSSSESRSLSRPANQPWQKRLDQFDLYCTVQSLYRPFLSTSTLLKTRDMRWYCNCTIHSCIQTLLCFVPV